MFTFWFSAVVFIGTYIVIASEKVHKTTAALIGASLMFLVVLHGPLHEKAESPSRVIEQSIEAGRRHAGGVNEKNSGTCLKAELLERTGKYEELDVFARYVNFDVIFTLAGMMLLVNVLSGTGIFQYVAIKSAKIARGSPIRTMILLVLSTAILSAFLDNVTTVLLIAPVTLLVATELGVPAIPFLMAETMASNIGGTATLIGDPPNLIIGSVARLDFAAFIINLTPFITGLMIIYCICLKLYYSKRMQVTVEKRARIMELDENAAITDPVNMKRGGLVMALTIIGFLVHGAVGIQPCVVAISGASLCLAVCKVDVDHCLEKIEWSTLFFFLGLFALVSGAAESGLMAEFSSLLAFTRNWNILVTILTVMWLSGICAAIMNNVSYTAAVVSIVAGFMATTPAFANPAYRELMWWALALAVCLGGNGTLVGAAANLVTAGIAEKGGNKVTFKEFLRYGLPVTAASLAAASLYIFVRYLLIQPAA
ncbi:MAG: ArsB/NhaD family transporter [Victivallaceae bacterium]|nr:ArsB/NhaD family transporter [Victivallaceae bacterium]